MDPERPPATLARPGAAMKRDVLPILFGVLLAGLLSATLLVAGLKAGINPGVSPLVILFAWSAFGRRVAGEGGARFLNLAQVAGSGGVAIAVGVQFTAPVAQIVSVDQGVAALEAEGVAIPRGLDGRPRVDAALLRLLSERGHPVPPVDVPTLMLLSAAGALIGFGFVGLGARRFLADPTLPAPEARACVTLIRAATAERAQRPRLGRSLGLGLGASFAARLAVKTGLASEHVALGSGRLAHALELPFVPIYLGIGGLLTLSTALLVFAGALLHAGGDALLALLPAGGALAERFPATSMRWAGGAAMSVAVVHSLLRFARVPAVRAVERPLVALDPPLARACRASVALGAAVVGAWCLAQDGATPFALAMTGGVLGCAAVMVALGALLSLQIGSSASPLSGTIFVTALVLCALALALGRRSLDDALLLTPLLVAACVAVVAANDSSQDFKTLELCGMRVQAGFAAQAAGLATGCLVVPAALSIAHRAYVLGSDELSAPQGKMYATLLDGLLLRSELPWAPILGGALVGLGAVALDVAARRRGRHLPAMALAVGIYLPAVLGTGILLGALARRAAEGRRAQTSESVLTAAGLITGAAALELLLGAALVLVPGFDAGQLVRLAPAAWLRDALGLAGIAALAALLWRRSRPPPG